MKKLFMILILSVVGLASFANIRWLTYEEMKERNLTSAGGVTINAVCYCNTKSEVESVCKIYNLDTYYFSTSASDVDLDTELYAVAFLEYKYNLPRMIVYHYISKGCVELYAIY